jgi:hypothetical protein
MVAVVEDDSDRLVDLGRRRPRIPFSFVNPTDFTSAAAACCFRERREERRVFARKCALLFPGIASCVRWPNKSLEPTTGTVTPRATIFCNSHARPVDARGAPVPVVAHL